MMEGTIYLARYNAQLLFDPSATHSFISFIFASKINKEPESMKFQLVVSTPVGAETALIHTIEDMKLLKGK